MPLEHIEEHCDCTSVPISVIAAYTTEDCPDKHEVYEYVPSVISVSRALNVAYLSLRQLLKAPIPILLTVFGIVTDVSVSQYPNALSAMLL